MWESEFTMTPMGRCMGNRAAVAPFRAGLLMGSLLVTMLATIIACVPEEHRLHRSSGARSQHKNAPFRISVAAPITCYEGCAVAWCKDESRLYFPEEEVFRWSLERTHSVATMH